MIRYFTGSLLVFLTLFIMVTPLMSQEKTEWKTEEVFEITQVKPVLVKQVDKKHYFIDFGKDAFGTLSLHFQPARADTLIVHLGEKTAGDFSIDKNPPGFVRYQQVKLPVTPSVDHYWVNLPRDRQNTGKQAIQLPDTFGVIMPFRYCEIEGLDGAINTVDIVQLTYHYRFNEEASSFTCSDTILNKIWDLCKYSIKATSFCGIYVDGDRERIPYEADALINQLGHYCVDREYSMARRTNEYFMSNPTWPTEWILQTAFLFYYDCMYTGDFESLRYWYDLLKYKTLIDLEREDGLISTKTKKIPDSLAVKLGYDIDQEKLMDIVDWPKGERDFYEMAEVNTVVNAFHYMSLKLMSKMAGFLNKTEDSVFFYRRAEKVKKAINEKLFDWVAGIYIDGENSTHSSIHANMFPLAFDLVPESHKKSVVDYIKSKGMACSVYGSQFLLEGLYKAGEEDYALGLMASTGDRSWWNMIASGSTITMEAWDMKYKPNADWNHAWGAAPANIITRCLWGIIPVKPGFDKVQIKPQLGPLTNSNIMVPTIKGPIRADYAENTDGTCVYSFSIPLGMEAEFIPRDDHLQILRVNNKHFRNKGESILLRPGMNAVMAIRK